MHTGGVTVYSPLRQYGAGKERKDVGIIGIGGLGHFVRLPRCGNHTQRI
jgi:alcohol dehydrogenase (NADP+)